jgi:hypothetical protein
MVSRDAPSRALCERLIMMTTPPSMRSSGSPGSWPPPGVYIRYLAPTYTRTKKLARFFRNLVTINTWSKRKTAATATTSRRTLPEPTARERTVGQVLALLTGTDATAT